MSTITITGEHLSLDTLRPVFRGPVRVALAPQAVENLRRAHQVILDAISRGDVVYGVNTGFGKLADRRISPSDLLELQRRSVLSHMVGVGDPLPDETVRAIMVIKLIGLARGHSGIRVETAEMIVDMINADVLPVIPTQGSVGASGDLAPLAHLAGALMGEGRVRIDGVTYNAVEGLAKAGLTPVELGPKEAVALLNGVQASTAIALRGLFGAEAVFNAGLAAGALTLEATAGRQVVLDDRIQQIRGHAGQIRVAGLLRRLVADSSVLDVEFEGRRLQDPYCLRCQPQVMGAALDLLTFAARTIQQEVNAVSDNPLMFPDDDVVLSGGNFHGQPIAYAADIIAMAICEIGSISERRQAMLMDASMSGLAPFLVGNAGLNSGFIMAQVTSAALVAENRAKATPNSVDSIPTSAGQEDHVSMATHASVRLGPMVRNAAYIIAIELLCAAQGLDLRNGGAAAPANRPTYDLVRSKAEFLEDDRIMAGEMEAVAAEVLDGVFIDIVGGPLEADA
ncbi:histidine ammonia-lyase [Micromonospora olivasterospora]|uniref:Histidine ammonia-lyase n=1 Tax=Micromonospora olivasterospora TaxID=1880 RepID=A0A562IJL5_MICOL|nr:histidine ammonia-lyase [Micromonospora olivasterospora]TWH70814.1 histidine ammonia-lyase [Micromonospora olivasterospora]